MPFSPRSASSTASLDSPCTPLEAVANRVRSVSVSVVSWSSGSKSPVPTVNNIPQDLQELYNDLDPFSYPGESFFPPTSAVDAVPANDTYLSHLDLYKECGLSRKQSCVSKKSTVLAPRLHLSFTNARMKTTIYDMSTADIVPTRATISVARTLVSQEVPRHDEEKPVDIVLSAASPTIVLTAPPSPTTIVKEHTRETVDNSVRKKNLQVFEEGVSNKKSALRQTPLGAVRTASRCALGHVSNTPIPDNNQGEDILVIGPTLTNTSDNFEPYIFKYATFPEVTYHPRLSSINAPSSSPFLGDMNCLEPYTASPEFERKHPLRQLVLPQQVAKRLSERTKEAHLSNGLEGIIALLDEELAKD
ncbi:hypothetical protein H0H92_008519 [Tricholoma furcatifolium]|nr:hypothetical protein H0H92_008519 [Tricholoma furcatifolium]